jgi:hypothetical protein
MTPSCRICCAATTVPTGDDGLLSFIFLICYAATMVGRIRIPEAQKHTDPTDPDSDPNPQH